MPDHPPLADAIARALEDAPEVLAAYLFGSMAAGRAHHDSDVDVALLLDWSALPTARHRFDARLRIGARLAAALHRDDLDLVILNDSPPHLAREIVTRGLRVRCADPEADHAFRRTAMLRAADLDPFLRRARRIKLAAIRR